MADAVMRERITALIAQHGSLRAAGRALGVDPSYLLRLRDGRKTNPSCAVLQKLKLRRVVVVMFVPCSGSGAVSQETDHG